MAEAAPDQQPTSALEPTDTLGPTSALLVRVLETMLRTRLFDEQLERLQRQGRIGFHVGSLGEEAAIVASAAALADDDGIFPCYRELGALLWRGFPLRRCLDNVFGNAVDVVQGRQMPDHYTAKHLAYASVSSPVGTQITHAVGYAWAAKLDGKALVAATYFGDGATSSNDFHAGLNFAGVWRLPVLFLCRNNHWAISVPLSRQTAVAHLADKAAAYGIVGEQCDGNDAEAVFAAVRRARARALAGEGATLLELLTYRTGGHSTSDDPRAYRPTDELGAWQQRDPLQLLTQRLRQRGLWSEEQEAACRKAFELEVKAAIEAAEGAAKPSLASMVQDVYREVPWHLQEQLAELEAGPRPRPRHG